MTAANLAALLQRFFTDRLRLKLGASPHTVASYRDTFRLLPVFALDRLARAPSQLRVEDLDTALLGALPRAIRLERGRVIHQRHRDEDGMVGLQAGRPGGRDEESKDSGRERCASMLALMNSSKVELSKWAVRRASTEGRGTLGGSIWNGVRDPGRRRNVAARRLPRLGLVELVPTRGVRWQSTYVIRIGERSVEVRDDFDESATPPCGAGDMLSLPSTVRVFVVVAPLSMRSRAPYAGLDSTLSMGICISS